jgi:membrane protease YdiL (CAAX protease family)
MSEQPSGAANPPPESPVGLDAIASVDWRATETLDGVLSPPSPVPVAGGRALVEVALCSGFPTQLVLIAVMIAAGATQGYTVGFLVPLLWLDTLLVVGLAWWFLRRSGDEPRWIWLGEPSWLREAAYGLFVVFPAVTLLIAALSAGLTWAWPWLHNVADNPLKALLQTPRDTALMTVTVMIAGGLREEAQRAFVLTRFRQSLGGSVLGLLFFSLAFGAGHVQQGWDAVILTSLLGLIWGVVYLVRGSIVAPVVSHAAFDVIQVLQFSLFTA